MPMSGLRKLYRFVLMGVNGSHYDGRREPGVQRLQHGLTGFGCYTQQQTAAGLRVMDQ